MKHSTRIIEKTKVIPASISDVWKDWTTKKGLESFFAPEAQIELRANGKFELYFLPDAEIGSRGSEGCKIMDFKENEVLFFTWNNPPHLDVIRFENTHVMLEFFIIDENTTHLRLTQQGWGEGGQWDEAYEYFDHAWDKVLLWNKEKYTADTE